MKKGEKKRLAIFVIITIVAWAVSIYVMTMPQEYWSYYRGIDQTILEIVAIPCIVIAGITTMMAAITIIGIILCMIIRAIKVIQQ